MRHCPCCSGPCTITETALFGPNHPTTAIWLDNLAVSYRALGRADEAVPLEERALGGIREGLASAPTGRPQQGGTACR